MNNKAILGLLLLIPSAANAQIYNSNQHDIYYYPLSSSQIESYNGVEYLLDFRDNADYIKQIFTDLDYIGDVESIHIKQYTEAKQWDKSVWVENEDKALNFDVVNDAFQFPYMGINIFRTYGTFDIIYMTDYFTVLNCKGCSEKSNGRLTATYTRDDDDRVVSIQITNEYRKIIGVYKYTYFNDSDKISTLTYYNSSGMSENKLIYEYENNHLVSVSWKSSNSEKRYKFYYNEQGDLKTVEYYRPESEYSKTTYNFTYRYLGEKIEYCFCEKIFENIPTSANYSWSFKYDAEGNWVEKILNSFDGNMRIITKTTRELVYSK